MSWPAPDPWAAASTTAGGSAQVPGPLERGHHQGLAAVGLLAAVEQVERLDDPARLAWWSSRVIGLLVEPGLGVGRRVAPVGHGHPAEVLGGGAGDVQVALGGHGHPRGRGEQAHRQVRGEVGVLGVGDRRPALDAGAEAVARALVEGPVADHHVGHPAGHGQGRLLDGGAGRPRRRSGCG